MAGKAEVGASRARVDSIERIERAEAFFAATSAKLGRAGKRSSQGEKSDFRRTSFLDVHLGL